jgi:hypothetical protein
MWSLCRFGIATELIDGIALPAPEAVASAINSVQIRTESPTSCPQAKCKGKMIELEAVDGIDVERLTDIVRAVLLLQRDGQAGAAPEASSADVAHDAATCSKVCSLPCSQPRSCCSSCKLAWWLRRNTKVKNC